MKSENSAPSFSSILAGDPEHKAIALERSLLNISSNLGWQLQSITRREINTILFVFIVNGIFLFTTL